MCWYSSLTIREGISAATIQITKFKAFPHYTWGYISKTRQEEKYMISSLTIREGISYRTRQSRGMPSFPHYTWGYIGRKNQVSDTVNVPSLYVRVYRMLLFGLPGHYGSLTIREGISLYLPAGGSSFGFPHYTWGYIDWRWIYERKKTVPSLYVRVYRIPGKNFLQGCRSLTIREGISNKTDWFNTDTLFPHYTWGYIGLLIQEQKRLSVPSLYVRVYRGKGFRLYPAGSSLTIREGISAVGQNKAFEQMFPHYTWGYIEGNANPEVKTVVPSLYVRVYRII